MQTAADELFLVAVCVVGFVLLVLKTIVFMTNNHSLTPKINITMQRFSRSLLQKFGRPTVASSLRLLTANVGSSVRCISHSHCVSQQYDPPLAAAFTMEGSDSSESSSSDSNSSSDSDSSDGEDDTPPLTYSEHGNDLSAGENPTQYRNRSIDELGRSYGTGRRKTAVARVWIKPGMGQFSVNSKSLAEYFPSTVARFNVLEPFFHTETSGMFDVYSTVKGGGRSGQAGALRLGVARAIEAFEPSFKPVLKESKYDVPPSTYRIA